MLVLSRKQHEAVVVGGSAGFKRTLKVTVLEINGRSVKLGFEADKGVAVHRWEVWERIRLGLPASPGEEWSVSRRQTAINRSWADRGPPQAMVPLATQNVEDIDAIRGAV